MSGAQHWVHPARVEELVEAALDQPSPTVELQVALNIVLERMRHPLRVHTYTPAKARAQ